MIEFVTSPKGKIAADIFDEVKELLGVTAASKWMFSANAWLDGKTPIQMIREDEPFLVWMAVQKIRENKRAA